ncbi:MAG: right-handed parallel beta-helix repeat-containing protein [Victivallales bacterium]|nr:right-handed parallel beta-helix repeat-containing protein [Victivallales bacterium]
MKNALAIVATCLLITGCRHTSPAPRTGIDLRQSIAEQVAAGKRRIVVPAGDYRVAPVDGVHLTISGLKDCEVRLDGVRMICTETTRALDVRRCENVTVRGLTIDYDPLPFTQFVITGLDEEKRQIEMRLPAGYEINDLVTHSDLGHLVVLDPAASKLKVIYGGPERVQKVGDRLYRYTKYDCYQYVPGRHTEKVGDVIVMNNHYAPNGRQNHAVLVGDSTNLTMADITVHAAPMMAFFEGNCNGVTYRRCINDRCPPADDYRSRGIRRMRSSGRDGFHLLGNRGKTVLDGCVSRFMDDDGVNIHGSGNPVVSIKGRIAVVGDKQRRLTVKVGDTVDLISFAGVRLGQAVIQSIGSGLEPTAEFKKLWQTHVHKTRLLPTRTWALELDREVPGAGPGTFLFAPARVGSNCVIRNCTFGYTRSRGIVLRASQAVIENNTIEGNWDKGIMMTGDFLSLEGGFPSAVRIVGNTISSVRNEAIYAAFINPYGKPAPAGLYRNIAITNNTISGATTDLELTSIDGLKVQDNRYPDRDNPVVNIKNCTNLVMDGK